MLKAQQNYKGYLKVLDLKFYININIRIKLVLVCTLSASEENLKHSVNLLPLSPLKIGVFSMSQNLFDIIVPS